MSIDSSDVDTENPLEAAVWKQARAALNAGEEERAITLLQHLAGRGDWRASTSLGFIFEGKGAKDSKFYAQAAHWYTDAIGKWDRPEPHLGLARYYYFGLGGSYDFPRAYEHLTMVVPDENPEGALMMAELLLLGLGCNRDVVHARRLFALGVAAGYPLGLLGLARIAKLEGRYFQAILLSVKATLGAAKLIWRNGKDPRLLGIGPGKGRLVLENRDHDR